VRFTRHAKNQARRAGVTVADVEALIANPDAIDFDEDGKPRYTGSIRGTRVRAVIALDAPDVIVTIHERRR
jgi:Domain of unknown function (DUF4258)